MKQFDLIYVVEDDPITQFLMDHIFSYYDSIKEVKFFNNGAIAFDSLQKNQKPDIILLDLNMPIMDGWEFLDAIQNIDKLNDIPVYIMTSSINKNDQIKSSKYKSVLGYFIKPFGDEIIDELGITDKN